MEIEVGFYHPNRGYWQALVPPGEVIMDSYPVGTVQIPLKPADGYEWDGAQWAVMVVDPAIALAEWRDSASASIYQFKAASLADAKLNLLNVTVAGLGPEDQLAWAEKIVFRRNDPVLINIAGLAGLTATDLDDLFVAAALIVE